MKDRLLLVDRHARSVLVGLLLMERIWDCGLFAGSPNSGSPCDPSWRLMVIDDGVRVYS